MKRRMKRRMITVGVLVALAMTVNADDNRRSHSSTSGRSSHHNYILERQEAYQVQGVPTSRLIIGKREIDVYPNGMMFEKNNLVGVREDR
jgi:hypothetical protein